MTTVEISVISSGPCTNCGSHGWTTDARGHKVRGCCTENGEQVITLREVPDDEYRALLAAGLA